MKKSSVLFALLILVSAVSGFRSDQPMRYFLTPTLPFKTEKTQAFTFDFDDEMSDDSLFQNLSGEGYPVSYHRRLKASVCFDDKCRLLDVIIYWNTTGRYLGFELPPKEFLSKADHKPFTEEEYHRLNELLADEQSALAKLSYEELVPKPAFMPQGVDAISSATAKNVLEYIVKGAAYTTYKMWHFIYGPAHEKVTELTVKSLSPDLILKILESPNGYDKFWALNHINGFIQPSPELLTKLLALVGDKNYSLSERAIHALSADDLASHALQMALMQKFRAAGYSQRKLLLNKIKEAPTASEAVTNELSGQLASLSAELVSDVLGIFKKWGVKDLQTCRAVSALLQNDNNFIAQKAMKFLEDIQVKDEQILGEMDVYRRIKKAPK